MTQVCLDHGFLASSEVLESVLLPYLSARDLFKLSCTSKGMQKWLLGTAPHLWQDDQPSNVCPGYLAALPSTGAVVAALQQAHRAKLAILAKSEPVQQTTITLSLLIPGPFSSWEGQIVLVEQVTFSACGQYLALGLLCCATQHQRVSENVAACLVFTATGGFAQQACICGPLGSSDPKIRWAADAPLLTIAHKVSADMPDSLPAEQAALRVLDAATGQVVHAVGPQYEAALRQMSKVGERLSQMELSPSGSMLLATSCCWEDPEDTAYSSKGQGHLFVLDIMQDSIVLQSAFDMTIPVHEEQMLMCIMGLAAWHPSSKGLVLSHCVDLQLEEHAEPGLAIATLPVGCYLNIRQTTTFSPDGQRLAVVSIKEPNVMEVAQGFLRCSITGMTMTLVPELCIEHPISGPLAEFGCQWLPCSSRMVLWVRRAGSMLLDLNCEENEVWQDPNLSPPIRFNHSQQLLTDASRRPRILRAGDGQELWAASAGTQQAASIASQSFEACGSVFLPSGCGMLSVEDDKIQVISFA